YHTRRSQTAQPCLCLPFFSSGRTPPAAYTLSLHDALPISRSGDDSSAFDFGNFARVELPFAGAHHAFYLFGVSCANDRARNAKQDRKSTRLNSSHVAISYAVLRLQKKTDPPYRKLAPLSPR